MQRGIYWLAGSIAALALTFGCAENQAGPEGRPTERSSGAAPISRAGWARLQTGATSDEVLGRLGHPVQIRVGMLVTYWYYSDRGDAGPYVCFDTRPMTVLRWREP